MERRKLSYMYCHLLELKTGLLIEAKSFGIQYNSEPYCSAAIQVPC